MINIVNKWKTMPMSVKSSSAFVFSSFFIRGISFLTTPIFTRIMDQTQYGIIATYNSWSLIIEVLAVLGMTSAGIINVGLNEHESERDMYLSAVTGLGNVSTIIVFVVLFIVNTLLHEFILPSLLLLLLFIHFLFYPAQIYWLTRQRYEYKYKLATILTISSVVVSQILAVVFVLMIKENQGSVKLWASEIGILLVCIPIYIFILIKGKKYYDKNIWKQSLRFAIPLIPHYLAQHLMSSADRIMLSRMRSEADAGIYNLVYNISWIVTLLWNAVNASLVPATFQSINKKDYNKIRNVVKIILLFYAIGCVLIIMIAPEVLKLLAPSEYYQGVYAVPPLVAVGFLIALYNIYANIEFYYKKSKYITTATIIAAAINLALNWVIIPRFGYIGASYTTLVSYIVLILLHYYGYRKSTTDKIYDDKFILIIAIIVIVVCVAFTFLYLNSILRYCVTAALLIALVILNKRIRLYVKEIKECLK